jgi:hypothetical protein
MSSLNLPNLIRVRDHLAKVDPQAFDLSMWFQVEHRASCGFIATKKCGQALEGSCGTTACIAGHVLALFTPNEFMSNDPATTAAELLGLSEEAGNDLFLPWSNRHVPVDYPGELTRRDLPNGTGRADVTTSQAVQVLDHLIETGEVDWRVIS